jgi:hypothetical protein
MATKNKHGLSDAELFLADAMSDESVEPAPAQATNVYFAARINGVRVEIEGPPEAAVKLISALQEAMK